jgi:flagellar export protein FliJ
MKKALNLFLKISKIREERAQAQFKKLNFELKKSEQFSQQVSDYVKEYGEQMIQTAEQGVQVAFLQDSNAFRNRLENGVNEQKQQIVGMKHATEQSKEYALASQMKVQAIEKVLKRKNAEFAHSNEVKENKVLEDGLVARIKK